MSFAALFFFILLQTVSAHTWADEIRRIASNGTFTGEPGYPRGYYPRLDAYNPNLNVHKLLLDPTNQNMCGSGQQPDSPAPVPGYPKLTAAAGEFIAIRYDENGHATQPQQSTTNTHTRPMGSGLVFVYGTETAKQDAKFGDIHRVWNKDQTGGDKTGRLLAVQYFDDMECFIADNNNGNLVIDGMSLSQLRAKAYPHTPNTLAVGAGLLCQTDFQLPSDLKANTDYTIYWVWEWPILTIPGAEIQTNETYTICADIAIEAGEGTQTVDYVAPQDYRFNAQWSQMVNPFVVDPTASQALYTTRSTTDLFASPTISASFPGVTPPVGAATANSGPATTSHAAPSLSTGGSTGGRATASPPYPTSPKDTTAGSAQPTGGTGSGTSGSHPVVSPFLGRALKIRGRSVL